MRALYLGPIQKAVQKSNFCEGTDPCLFPKFVCFCVKALRGKRKEAIILNVSFSLPSVTYNSVSPVLFLF